MIALGALRGPRRLFLVALALMAACADPRPRTEVLVMFEADRAVQRIARDIELDVYSVDRDEAVPSLLVQSLPLSLDSIGGFPVTHALVPLDDGEVGLFRIEGRLYGDQPDEPIATVRAISGYVKDRTLILRLRFYARCLYIDCANPDESCGSAGDCEPATQLPGDLPPLVEDLDGGAESIEPFCTNDLDCDDSVACTVDTCLTDSCVNTADDSQCTIATGGTCNPSAGCQYGACDATSCVRGACEASATCEAGVCVRVSACRVGEQCCGDSCVPSSCNDGNACTTDGCDPAASACTSTATTGSCDDGLFCNGADKCSDGACTFHGGTPCSGAAVCDEGSETCASCRTTADCPPTTVSTGVCVSSAESGPCSTAGVQTVETISYACVSGTCDRRPMTGSSTCVVEVSSTMACGTGPAGPFGPCMPTHGPCSTMGTHTAMAPLYRCGPTGMCDLDAGTTTISEACPHLRPGSCDDAGVAMDGGRRCDAGLCDGGVDAGHDSGPADSGLRDGGPRDSGTGTRDASVGPRDSGTGIRDSGPRDSGADETDMPDGGRP